MFNYAKDLDPQFANSIFIKLNETFGESLLPNLLSASNISSDVGLDLII